MIVKSLFLGYFHAPASKRPEAINVIGHILSFTKEEMEEVSDLKTVLINYLRALPKHLPFVSSRNFLSSVSIYKYYCFLRPGGITIIIKVLLFLVLLCYSLDSTSLVVRNHCY